MKRILKDTNHGPYGPTIKSIKYKGHEIMHNLYGTQEYSVFHNGDDLIFESLLEAKKYINQIKDVKPTKLNSNDRINDSIKLLEDAKNRIRDNIKILKDSLFKSAVIIDEYVDLTKIPNSLAGQLALNRNKLYNAKNFKELYDMVIEIVNNPLIAKQPGVEKARYVINDMKDKYYNLDQNSRWAMAGYETLLRYIVNIQLNGSNPELSITKFEKSVGNDKYKKYKDSYLKIKL